MMPKLFINGNDIYATKGFFLQSWKYKEGNVQTKYIDVPGRAEPLDLSTYLTGSVVVNMPVITVTIIKTVDDVAELATTYKDFCDTYNTKKYAMTRKQSSLTDRTYIGRISVTDVNYDYNMLSITFEMQVESVNN